MYQKIEKQAKEQNSKAIRKTAFNEFMENYIMVLFAVVILVHII